MSTGVTACDAYLANFKVLARCEKATQSPGGLGLGNGWKAIDDAWRSWADLEGEALKAAHRAAEPGCVAALESLRRNADVLGCEWPYLK